MGLVMNLAAILPHGLSLSDACQLVQTTFLGLCCFFATGYFSAVFVPSEPENPVFFRENPYFSYSSRIFVSASSCHFLRGIVDGNVDHFSVPGHGNDPEKVFSRLLFWHQLGHRQQNNTFWQCFRFHLAKLMRQRPGWRMPPLIYIASETTRPAALAGWERLCSGHLKFASLPWRAVKRAVGGVLRAVEGLLTLLAC